MYWTIAASAFDTVHTLPSLEFLKSRLEEICYSTRSFAKGVTTPRRNSEKGPPQRSGSGPPGGSNRLTLWTVMGSPQLPLFSSESWFE